MNNEFVTGDTGSSLVVTCADRLTGLPINLTGASVSLNWKTGSTLFSKAMTVDNPVTGVVKYQFREAELTAPKMAFEVEITDAGGKVITNLDLITVSVREQLA